MKEKPVRVIKFGLRHTIVSAMLCSANPGMAGSSEFWGKGKYSRHGHGKKVNEELGVEWLQNVT